MARRHPRRVFPLLAAWLLLSLLPALPAVAAPILLLQSTTSTRNSGLLDHILPIFRQQTGIEVRVVAVGTGQALLNAANGDGDVVLVHAPEAEARFVARGHGVRRARVMYNDFVLVGPPADPAGIAGMEDAAAALARIAAAGAPFASRGDDSGTHQAERRLWRAAGIDPESASGGWYRETGSGMGATLNTGIGSGAYILTDRATWIAFRNRGEHRILLAGDPRLFNQYGVIQVNPDRHPHVRAEAARRFVEWILSAPGQAAIAGFRLDGQQLFFPNAGPDAGSAAPSAASVQGDSQRTEPVSARP